jgi:4-hydroxybenzoate polyprenyltransferase
MKRITHYPQVWLGLSMGWGIWVARVPMGTGLFNWDHAPSAHQNTIFPSSCLYDTYTLWTVIDDTVYAHQDVKNDCQAGVKSMAVKFGDRTKPLLVVLAVAQVGLLVQLQDRRRR